MTKATKLSIILIALAGAALCLAQTSRESLTPQELARRSAEYIQLNRRIYPLIPGQSDQEFQRLSREEDVDIAAKLHDIIHRAISDVFASPSSTAGDLKLAIGTIQGRAALSADDHETNTPFAERFELAGSAEAAVAYVVLGAGGAIADTQPAVLFFRKAVDGKWELRATAAAEFEGSTFFIWSMSRAGGERWYLTSGTRLGDTGARLSVRLYAFDGTKVRTVWKRDDLVRGLIDVSADSVTLDYDPRYAPLERLDRIHEVLHITPNGLQ